jgi:hypothetical protein
MKKVIFSKILIIGVILLFIGVGIQPAFSIEPEFPVANIEKEEDCDCQKVDISDSFMVKLWLNKLKVFNNIILLKFGHIPEIEENCNDIFNFINSYYPLSDGEIVCTILVGIYLGILSIYWSIRELQEEVGGLLAALLYFPLIPIATIGLFFEMFVYTFCEEYLPDTPYEIKQIVLNW